MIFCSNHWQSKSEQALMLVANVEETACCLGHKPEPPPRPEPPTPNPPGPDDSNNADT